LVELFGEKIQKLAPVSLVPIPLHPSREYVRGYNQAALFARELSGQLEMPVIDNLIIRVKKRKPQSKLNQSKREANIKNVFELAEEQLESDEARKVILVDDVVTSGHTMFEARRVLIAGGHDVVGAIAMARAL
jgi:ComF family protein